MTDRTRLLLMVGVFLLARSLPVDDPRTRGALLEAFAMLREYARDHVVLCLVPALFLAGAISVFVGHAPVLKHLGPAASPRVAYPVAAVSGAILAVCSCTVLPLFAGIYRRGAGLGPASAFLYSGPAINVLAILLTARVLGLELGIARAVGAVLFAIVIGLLMHALFRADERERAAAAPPPGTGTPPRRPAQDVAYFAAMVGILVFASWSRPDDTAGGLWSAVYGAKWPVAGALAIVLAAMLLRWFRRDELAEWLAATWILARQILPLLLAGVLVAGFLLGRPGHEGMIPSEWITPLLGGNGPVANLGAALVGALMYFATLTEVPILQGLTGAGMGKGPALALLLSGPAVSLPSLLVIRSVLGARRTIAYAVLVIVLSAAAGLVYGALFAGR